MADGTRVYEPPDGTDVVAIDTVPVTLDDASVVERQRITLAGSAGEGTAEVRSRTDGVVAVEVADDCTSFQAIHYPALTPEHDTTVTFDQPVRIIRILNWSTGLRVLVKDGAITDSTDVTATRVGFAPTTSVPGSRTLPFITSSIHLLSSGAAEVTVEGYF